jgi:hypothetical protein
MRSWVPPPARVNVEDTAWRVEYGEVFRVRRLRDACVAVRVGFVSSPFAHIMVRVTTTIAWVSHLTSRFCEVRWDVRGTNHCFSVPRTT